MSRRRFLLRRGLFALLAAYAVLTAAFAFIELTPDPNLALRLWLASVGTGGQPLDEVRRSYLATHGGTAGPLAKYVRWLWRFTTLQWGVSYQLDEPVVRVLGRHLRVTALYLVPALVVSTVVGTAYGAYSAANRGSLLDRTGELATYLAFGLPNVFLAVALPVALRETGVVSEEFAPPSALPAYGSVTVDLLVRLAVPAFVVCTTLVAGVAHYTRSETGDRLGEQFVKLVRAKGATNRRVARHVLRNAMLPLVALTFSEFLAVVVVHVFVVENVFGIPGFGTMFLEAIRARDVPVVMGATFVVVLGGILGNFLQDVLAAVSDPRLGD